MRSILQILLSVVTLMPVAGMCQQAGSIRGMVYDKEYDIPLAGAEVVIVENGVKTIVGEGGNYVIDQLAPGAYTLIFSKEGYTRQVQANVLVAPGALTDVDMKLPGEFTDLEEFGVEDMEFDSSSTSDLMALPELEIRLESPAFLDIVGSDVFSKAGASDAASALKLVSGASVQDGKYAVIRGLPDRYVNSQMNGVRLPTADTDKRAVQLDQFPAAAIERIQVSKVFTPDQQGDASGGAVNLILKGIPEKSMFEFSSQSSYNSQAGGNDRFLSYKGGGVNFWGDQNHDIQYDNMGGNWDGAVGVSEEDAPIDSKWSIDIGKRHEIEKDFTIGGIASFFYERDSSYYDNGINDRYWVETPGAAMSPQYIQGTPDQGDFKTQLFDVTRGSEEVKWGRLGSLGVKTENHSLTLSSLSTRVTESISTLAEDTRGKEYYFPGYNPYDPTDPGNITRDSAPYLRTETLEYTERTTDTLQLSGRHKLPDPAYNGNYFTMLPPEVDWTLANSSATLYQPDKRQFGSLWWGDSYDPGYPPYVLPSIDPAVHLPYKPAANYTLGNLQRTWKEIEETSKQSFLNLKLPFEQWSGDEGYIKVGVFSDDVDRKYDQESFSNFNDNSASYLGSFDQFWSEAFPNENHPISAADIDVDYQGKQKISAWYYMLDLPLSSCFNIIGGARFERTELSILNFPESDVTWIPPGSQGSVILNPGDSDVSLLQDDILPSLGFHYKPTEKVSLRGTYSETIARPTFKELTPIQQQDFLGGDVFIGNPELRMSSLKNYDLRLDYTPSAGSLYSVSYFYKEIKDPIEYVQRIADFPYTTPINYPEGTLSGIEMEIRQEMGHLSEDLEGVTLGGNATLISSEVTLPEEEAALFETPNINAPMPTRHMTNAPEFLYNLFLMCELDKLGISNAQLAVFYTVKGDTLIAGAGQSKGHFVPNVYEKEYGTLNLSLTKTITENWKMKLQAKNVTNPKIQTVYRSDYIGKDVVKTSYQDGIEYSIAMSAAF